MKGSDFPKKSFLSNLLAQNCMVALSYKERERERGERERGREGDRSYNKFKYFKSFKSCRSSLIQNDPNFIFPIPRVLLLLMDGWMDGWMDE